MQVTVKVMTITRNIAKQLPWLDTGALRMPDLKRVVGSLAEGAINRDSDACYIVELSDGRIGLLRRASIADGATTFQCVPRIFLV